MKTILSLVVFFATVVSFTDAVGPGEHSGGLFSYDTAAANGPPEWSSLDLGDTENACGGSKQSGIDIPTGPCNETNANYEFEPGTCTVNELEFTISDHSIQATYNTSACSPPRMTIPHVSSTFEATQFHFHTGSEHALDGKHYGGELHVVHHEVDGEGLAVLGFFLDPTSFESTDFFEDLIPRWETIAEQTLIECRSNNESDAAVTQGLHRRSLTQKTYDSRKAAETFNPYSLVPEGATFYYYSGSLTTPPCSEIVSWNVVDKPVSLSVHEYATLVDLVVHYRNPENPCELATVAAKSGETSRPTQPINGRLITHKCPTGTESQFDKPPQAQCSSAEIFRGSIALFLSCTASLFLFLSAC